jgi:gluconokinase
MIIVVFGPAGAGKSTVGRALAERLGWRFLEGDGYHSPDNIALMRGGKPLGDADRRAWLAALAREIATHIADGRDAVLACSALKRSYRAALIPACASTGDVQFVYLRVPREVLEARLRTRREHFFPAELLETQLVNLEEPAEEEPAPVLEVDGAGAVDAIVETICTGLALSPARPANARAAKPRGAQ